MVVRLLRRQYGSPIRLLSFSYAWMYHEGSLKRTKVVFISKVTVVTCMWSLDNIKFKSKKDQNNIQLIKIHAQINCLGYLVGVNVHRSPLYHCYESLKKFYHNIKFGSRPNVFYLMNSMLNTCRKRPFNTDWDHFFDGVSPSDHLGTNPCCSMWIRSCGSSLTIFIIITHVIVEILYFVSPKIGVFY